MLVLSRNPGESIVIGDDIHVTVIATRNGQVRLGIVAPSETRIDREEVRTRIAAQEQSVAARVSEQ